MTNIEYLGHACFKFTTQQGITVYTDPFHGENPAKPHLNIYYPLPQGHADFVLLSHQHHDHNAVELLDGQPVVLDQPGVFAYPELTGQAILADHDNVGGAEKGKILIFAFTLEGLRYCFLGDLGQERLLPEQVQAIGAVDVLMLPVGGGFTVGPEDALAVAAQLQPAYVLPMHYQCPQTPFLPYTLANFLDLLSPEQTQKCVCQASFTPQPQAEKDPYQVIIFA